MGEARAAEDAARDGEAACRAAIADEARAPGPFFAAWVPVALAGVERAASRAAVAAARAAEAQAALAQAAASERAVRRLAERRAAEQRKASLRRAQRAIDDRPPART